MEITDDQNADDMEQWLHEELRGIDSPDARSQTAHKDSDNQEMAAFVFLSGNTGLGTCQVYSSRWCNRKSYQAAQYHQAKSRGNIAADLF